MNRRTFLKAAAAAVLGIGGLPAYAFGIEPRMLRLVRQDVLVADLPPHLNGYTIGVLSDLHVDSRFSAHMAIKAAVRVTEEKPDLVVIVGDFTGQVHSQEEAEELLDEVLEPLTGAYGVLGNWDYYLNKRQAGVSRQKKVHMLVNEGVLAAPGLWLGGVDDGMLGKPDFNAALSGAPDHAIRILLAHEPDLADRVKPEHRVSLQISGHTHGGQVKLPFVGALFKPPLGKKYFEGFHQAPFCPVFTSRGVGMSSLPVRFMVPPEVALLTLRRL